MDLGSLPPATLIAAGRIVGKTGIQHADRNVSRTEKGSDPSFAGMRGLLWQGIENARVFLT
jgi:hypothetical protein